MTSPANCGCEGLEERIAAEMAELAAGVRVPAVIDHGRLSTAKRRLTSRVPPRGPSGHSAAAVCVEDDRRWRRDLLKGGVHGDPGRRRSARSAGRGGRGLGLRLLQRLPGRLPPMAMAAGQAYAADRRSR